LLVSPLMADDRHI